MFGVHGNRKIYEQKKVFEVDCGSPHIRIVGMWVWC